MIFDLGPAKNDEDKDKDKTEPGEFRSHNTLQECHNLVVGEGFDHRDKFGRVFPAQVSAKQSSDKWNIWSIKAFKCQYLTI